MAEVIATDRLRLRPLAAADADQLVRLDNDPQVMRFLSGGRPTAQTTIEREALPFLLAPRAPFAVCAWAAIEARGGGFVGWFSLRPPLTGMGGEAELGYRLAAAAWNRGYATEGASALIGRAFRRWRLERVFAETMAVNLASRRVMEKLGMAKVRAFHQAWPDPIPGSEFGEVEYAISRQMWLAKSPAKPPARRRSRHPRA